MKRVVFGCAVVIGVVVWLVTCAGEMRKQVGDWYSNTMFRLLLQRFCVRKLRRIEYRTGEIGEQEPSSLVKR